MNKVIIILCLILSHGLLYLKGHNDGAFELSHQMLTEDLNSSEFGKKSTPSSKREKQKVDELNDIALSSELGERSPASIHSNEILNQAEDFSSEADNRPYKEIGHPIEDL